MTAPKTEYLRLTDKDIPHSYYPRPQMRRDSYLCLNGEWDFSEHSEVFDQKITVPFCPESEASGIGRRVGEGLYYRRCFSLPEGFVRDRVILHFGAVDQKCKVYVNGAEVGGHKGGYLPFSFDITDVLTDGENELRVEVKDALDHRYPWGKQRDDRGGMWYTPVSGIWQTVWLESVPAQYIENIRITPEGRGVKIQVIGGEDVKRLTLETGETYEFSGSTVTVEPKSIRKWSPEDPYLYYFTLESGDDRIESYFALRYIDVREIGGIKRICLNGEPYLFNGLLDQGYFPEGIYTPVGTEDYIKDISTVKSMGFNMLRKHIKIEPMIFYYLCDSMGIAVFQDMVNNGGYSFLRDTAIPTAGIQRIPDKFLNRDKKAQQIFKQSMTDTVALLYNSPSVVYYTVFNEGWGQFRSDDMYELIKICDSTRIIDTTSGWFRQSKSDVDSRHIYFRPLKPKRLDGRPLVISEFGGYSYRVEGHVFGEKEYGYSSYESREELEEAIIALYENEVKPLVKAGASAFVYTQVSDVEDETNGFITYDREIVKVDTERIRRVMQGLPD